MSTDRRRFPTENQSATTRAYAARRGLQIVRTFADEGKSGLRASQGAMLSGLVEVAQGGRADFGSILVCDVSRRGRLQDADESAHYECICRRAGIERLSGDRTLTEATI